jgi:DNA repair protein RadD
MAGRGTRLSPGKENCLVLDFAGNVARHGPIDAIKPRRPKPGDGDAAAPTRVCPDCQSIVAAATRECPDCGHQFPPPAVKVETRATTLAILSTGGSQWRDVDRVSYSRHEKPGGRPSLRVDYQCGLTRHSEWVCFEHTGYARQKAVAWWRRRAPGTSVPASVNEALQHAAGLAEPSGIAVRPNGRFTEIVSHRFGSCAAPTPASAPSAAASPADSAGSTPPSGSAIRAATPAAAGSAASSARTSAIGGAA